MQRIICSCRYCGTDLKSSSAPGHPQLCATPVLNLTPTIHYLMGKSAKVPAGESIENLLLMSRAPLDRSGQWELYTGVAL